MPDEIITDPAGILDTVLEFVTPRAQHEIRPALENLKGLFPPEEVQAVENLMILCWARGYIDGSLAHHDDAH